MFGIAAVLFVAVNFLGIGIPEILVTPLNIVIALMPTILWMVFSLLPERGVPEPRTQLLPVFIISALVANAIGIPFIDGVLTVESWLSLVSALERISGYMFTIGIVHCGIVYVILRYMVWRDHLRTRLDTVSYAATVAVGYTMVLNLQFTSIGTPLPDVVAMRVFANLSLHLVANITVAYGLSEQRFANAMPLLPPLSIAFAAFLTGVFIPVRAGLINGSFSGLGVTAPRPLFGLGFTVAFLAALLVVLAFLFNNAERQEREMQAAAEDV